MSDYQHKPGTGTLFQNDQKGNAKAPTHRGELCLEDGTVIRIAGWRKEGKKGPFLSLSIDKPRDGGGDFRGEVSRGSAGSVAGRRDDYPDDKIPWATSNSIW